jgi:hypothetical protein
MRLTLIGMPDVSAGLIALYSIIKTVCDINGTFDDSHESVSPKSVEQSLKYRLTFYR